ncbi:conserved hypothetical protein [Methanocella arvoryzae MRE50]|uniref:DUF2206 domain-containing protein n=1 Tax=Methanocella arvoryzae (strain DSM 22066 / NBRC 105507 / MRE50) TaxID=351160 RepID=Q0W4G2_METAR|nr:conserved hypothetical protein [Methanocella arvoryzae MRE50]
MSSYFEYRGQKVHKYIVYSLILNAVLISVLYLDAEGITVSVLRGVISFIFLTFVPGFLIGKILRLDKQGFLEFLLYSIGLSLMAIMITGFLLNISLPIIGIHRPISEFFILSALSSLTVVLCLICHHYDNDFSNQVSFSYTRSHIKMLLLISLLPILAVIATFTMNYYETNILLYILLILVSLVIALVTVKNIFPEWIYPYLVFIMALSLLFHNSLISNYVWGWDVQQEYYVSKLVVDSGFWNSSIPTNVNAMLSIVILGPVYSIISGLSMEWVFKIIYQFFFALVPIVMYLVFKKLTNPKVAVLSVIFFITTLIFYKEMIQLCRQEIAELFLTLLLLLLLNNNLPGRTWGILFSVFSCGIIISHYGLTYMVIGLIALSYVLFTFINLVARYINTDKVIIPVTPIRLNFLHICIFIFIALSWYIAITSSTAFYSVSSVIYQVISSMFTESLNPTASQGLAIIQKVPVSQMHLLYTYIYYFNQVCIVLGLLYLSYKTFARKNMYNYSIMQLIMCGVAVMVLVGSIVLPYFASALNTTRIYHIMQFFVSPVYIIGFIFALESIPKVYARIVKSPFRSNLSFTYGIISLFLCVYLLFNSGVIFQILNDHPSSMALGGVPDYPLYNDLELESANWMTDPTIYSGYIPVYSDYYRSLLISGKNGRWDYTSGGITSYNWSDANIYVLSLNQSGTYYTYLGSYNINKQLVYIDPYPQHRIKNLIYTSLNNLALINEIYDNGGSVIYYNI